MTVVMLFMCSAMQYIHAQHMYTVLLCAVCACMQGCVVARLVVHRSPFGLLSVSTYHYDTYSLLCLLHNTIPLCSASCVRVYYKGQGWHQYHRRQKHYCCDHWLPITVTSPPKLLSHKVHPITYPYANEVRTCVTHWHGNAKAWRLLILIQLPWRCMACYCHFRKQIYSKKAHLLSTHNMVVPL